jgi:hypothetical protein
MNYIQRIGTILNSHVFGITGNETPVEKYTKLVVGTGITGFALVAWKITVTAGLFYSAYKGGEIAYNRFFQKREVRRDSSAAANAVLEEAPHLLILPVEAGHDAHGEREGREAPVAPEEHFVSGIRKLKELQSEWIQNPRVKDPAKMRLIFKAMISHPEAFLNGGQLHWIQKKMSQYSKNSSWKLRWLQFKHRFQCYEKPKKEAPK